LALQNGNEKRQPEAATRSGKMQKYIYQAKTLRWEGNRAPQRPGQHRENKELQGKSRHN